MSENKPTFRCVMVNAAEPGEPGTFAMIVWYDCEFDIVAAGIQLEDPEHALDTPLPAPGIWIWEGFFKDDANLTASGVYREPTEPEWAAIRKGNPPWDAARESEALRVRNELLKEHPEFEPQLRYGSGFYLTVEDGAIYLNWVDIRRLRVGAVEKPTVN